MARTRLGPTVAGRLVGRPFMIAITMSINMYHSIVFCGDAALAYLGEQVRLRMRILGRHGSRGGGQSRGATDAGGDECGGRSAGGIRFVRDLQQRYTRLWELSGASRDIFSTTIQPRWSTWPLQQCKLFRHFV